MDKQTKALARLYTDALAYAKWVQEYKAGKRDDLPDVRWVSLREAREALAGVDIATAVIEAYTPEMRAIANAFGIDAAFTRKSIADMERG